MKCFFVSDLHGKLAKYNALFEQIKTDIPDVLFLGGDLLPHVLNVQVDSKYGALNDFIYDYLIPAFEELKKKLKEKYPEVFLILGNDDPKIEESKIHEGENMYLWNYIHNKMVEYNDFKIFGYANIPPTPFLLKDWELYDVSRFVDPGCVPPTAGVRTVVPERDIEYTSIQEELKNLTKGMSLENAIFLFHSPPYKSNLDRADLDGQMFDHVPLDVHVGSIAIQRFISEKKPFLTLHGHVHESSRLTGKWFDMIEKTLMFSAAYDADQLAIISFDTENLATAKRRILNY